MPSQPAPDIVGLRDVDALLGVADKTSTQWRKRGIFPEPDGMLNGVTPFWMRRRVISWARKTGRWPDDKAQGVPTPAAR